MYIVNPSIEIRLFNWKRPVYLPDPTLGFKPNSFYVTLELMDKGNVVLKQLIATELKYSLLSWYYGYDYDTNRLF